MTRILHWMPEEAGGRVTCLRLSCRLSARWRQALVRSVPAHRGAFFYGESAQCLPRRAGCGAYRRRHLALACAAPLCGIEVVLVVLPIHAASTAIPVNASSSSSLQSTAPGPRANGIAIVRRLLFPGRCSCSRSAFPAPRIPPSPGISARAPPGRAARAVSSPKLVAPRMVTDFDAAGRVPSGTHHVPGTTPWAAFPRAHARHRGRSFESSFAARLIQQDERPPRSTGRAVQQQSNRSAQTQPYRLLQAPRSLAARPDAATVQDPARTTTSAARWPASTWS